MTIFRRGALIVAAIVGASWIQTTARADSAMFADDHFNQGEWWSVNGKNGSGDRIEWRRPGSLQGDVMYIRWTASNGWWESRLDTENYVPATNLGTHVAQTQGADDQVSQMYFTNDGNLLMLANDGRGVLWQTFTGNNWGGWFNLQGDGNLVVYNSGAAPLWSLF